MKRKSHPCNGGKGMGGRIGGVFPGQETFPVQEIKNLIDWQLLLFGISKIEIIWDKNGHIEEIRSALKDPT